MAEWWELDELDEEAEKAKQLAYYNSFYASEENRAVMSDIHKYVHSRFPTTQEYAMGSLALVELYFYIRKCCGIHSEKDVIDAEGGVINLGE